MQFFHFCLAGFRYRRRRFVQSQNTVQCMSEWSIACWWGRGRSYSKVGSGSASTATSKSGRSLCQRARQCAGQLSSCTATQTTLPAVCHQSAALNCGGTSLYGQELNGSAVTIFHLGSRILCAASSGLSAF